MRIAYFTDTFLPQINGVTNTLEKLGEYLLTNNIPHMFFVPEYPDDLATLPKSPIHRFKSISLPLYPECRLSIPLYVNLCKRADEFRPDIIHIVTPLGIGLAGLKYARERNIPVVSSFHTNFDIYLRYYKLDYLEEALWNYFRWFHSFSSINFCPSHATLETLKCKDIHNLKIWSRGIDTGKYTRNGCVIHLKHRLHSGSKTVFLYVGRLAVEKDLDILMDSINEINIVYPGKAEFILVGNGPMAKQLKKNSYENIRFTGYLRGKELSAVYASADVFVFPSSTETFGNVVLEAMAAGLPVIAVSSGGVKDSIMHGYNGLLCEPRDSESLIRGIERFLNNKNLIISMGMNAKKYALTKSWKHVFDQLLSDYASALTRKEDQKAEG